MHLQVTVLEWQYIEKGWNVLSPGTGRGLTRPFRKKCAGRDCVKNQPVAFLQ